MTSNDRSATTVGDAPLAEAYLDLCKEALTGGAYRAPEPRRRDLRWVAYQPVRWALARRGLELVKRVDPGARAEGLDYSSDATTMIGHRRLDNLQECIVRVLRDGVPGDLIETGVWRGGAAIFMRAVLKAYGDTRRKVWVADSFQGLPRPDTRRYPADVASNLWTMSGLAVSLDSVRENFRRYGLLDDQVRFLPGWFRDTLPGAPIHRLAVLRLDGDMYESTMDALSALYDKVVPGGYVIVDDYGAVEGCRRAVDQFRREQAITEDLHRIDWTGVYWRRATAGAPA
ncbi:MAG: TylF/MycF family methyltransferase [Actinomycetota bacterium]|nr:TylF/MycF family methyltransferase [Actinomycetota bacterium]